MSDPVAPVNRWKSATVNNKDVAPVGIIRKNSLLRVKLTLSKKAATSGAPASEGDYFEFDCKSKGIPAIADAPTWTDVTDRPDELTGFAYAGKSEQLEVIELVTRTPVMIVYDELVQHQAAGDLFTLLFTYDDPHETKIYTITVPNVQIIGVTPEAGENNAGSQTTIKLLPEGGSDSNMPDVAEVTRT